MAKSKRVTAYCGCTNSRPRRGRGAGRRPNPKNGKARIDREMTLRWRKAWDATQGGG